MKKIALATIIGLLCISPAFAAPGDYQAGGLFEIDSIAPTTTSVVGSSSPTAEYEIPVSDPSIHWMNISTSGNVWDLSDMSHNIWIQGSVTDVNCNEGWATVGLIDKHFSDGLGVNLDTEVNYASGHYGLGRNAGLTIAGDTTTNEDVHMKGEDGWGAPNGQTGMAETGLGAFEFMVRFGFTDGPDRDTRTLRAWYREIGATEWLDVGLEDDSCSLGYPINGSKTDRPERYLNDQWDQIMLAVTVVNDKNTLSTSYSTGTITMFKEVTLAGDCNGDGFVDEIDATIMAANWGGGGGATWQMGDFTGDGKIDGDDAAALAANWLSDGSVATSAVPEPSSLLLLGLGCLVLLAGKRLRK